MGREQFPQRTAPAVRQVFMRRWIQIGGTVCTVLASGLACQDMADRPSPGRSATQPQLSFDPDSGSDGVPPVLRIHVQGGLNPGELTLFRGTLTQRELKEIRASDMSKTLQGRQISILAWQSDGEVVVAPSVKLDLGTQYTVAAAKSGWSSSFQVISSDPEPYWARVWPPIGSPSIRNAIWCRHEPAEGQVQGQDRQAVFWPGPVGGKLALGALGGIGEGCVSWAADTTDPAGPLVPPPYIQAGDGRWARLDPSPLQGQLLPNPSYLTECATSEVFGPICLQVQDDRIALVSRGDPVWVSFSALDMRWTGIVEQSRQPILRPLPPNATLVVEGISLDLGGNRRDWSTEVKTMPTRPHVVVNEVMANPRGTEPDQEWVELYNDGAESVPLVGWTLEDIGGQVVLPQHVLPPGAFVLIVNDTYQADAWGDRPARPGTPLVRVTHLGKDGLGNSGEPLRLRNSQGDVMSSVPAISAPKQSSSVARTTPDAPDDLPSSFFLCGDGGTPGATNRP